MKQRVVQYDPRKDYYQILGVEPKATQQELQQAYRQKAKTVHPDRNPDKHEWATEQFQLLNEAYDLLSNPALRSNYDDQRYRFHPARAGENWWDVRQAPQEGYNGVNRPRPNYTPYTPRPRAGAWLEKYHLGLIRPFYAGMVDLINSPYRYVLIILALVAAGNVIFIMTRLPSEAENNAAETVPTQTLTSLNAVTPTVVEGFVGFATAPVSPQICPDDLQLQIVQIERPISLVKITAYPPYPNLNSRNVQFASITIEEDSIYLGAEWEPANLIFQTEQGASNGDENSEILGETLYNIDSGTYLLRWSPVLADATLPEYCDQIIIIP